MHVEGVDGNDKPRSSLFWFYGLQQLILFPLLYCFWPPGGSCFLQIQQTDKDSIGHSGPFSS